MLGSPFFQATVQWPQSGAVFFEELVKGLRADSLATCQSDLVDQGVMRDWVRHGAPRSVGLGLGVLMSDAGLLSFKQPLDIWAVTHPAERAQYGKCQDRWAVKDCGIDRGQG